jgi:hypothetical protein
MSSDCFLHAGFGSRAAERSSRVEIDGPGIKAETRKKSAS